MPRLYRICSAKSIPVPKMANPQTLDFQGFAGSDFCGFLKILFPLIQTQFLIFPLIPMLCGFSIPACSANCSADLKENRKRAEQETFPFPALSALYPYYFFLSSSFCMLFSSLFAISFPYLSILSSFCL